MGVFLKLSLPYRPLYWLRNALNCLFFSLIFLKDQNHDWLLAKKVEKVFDIIDAFWEKNSTFGGRGSWAFVEPFGSVFFPVTTKSARDTPPVKFCHGHFWLFTGIIIENCHGQAQKFHGHFYQISHGQVGNFTVKSKKSCHGQFKVCHGHFCSLTSKFLIYSYHNKGDIWTLASREYY